MFIKHDATAWLLAITTICFYIIGPEPDDLIRRPIGVH